MAFVSAAVFPALPNAEKPHLRTMFTATRAMDAGLLISLTDDFEMELLALGCHGGSSNAVIFRPWWRRIVPSMVSGR